jgi:hypothetical protein
MSIRSSLHHLVDCLDEEESAVVLAYVESLLALSDADVRGFTAALPSAPSRHRGAEPSEYPASSRGSGGLASSPPSLDAELISFSQAADDPLAGVPTDSVVDLLLALEPWLRSPPPALYQLAAEARQRWPSDWGQRLCHAYKTAKPVIWEQAFVPRLHEQLLGESRPPDDGRTSRPSDTPRRGSRR